MGLSSRESSQGRCEDNLENKIKKIEDCLLVHRRLTSNDVLGNLVSQNTQLFFKGFIWIEDSSRVEWNTRLENVRGRAAKNTAGQRVIIAQNNEGLMI